MSDLSPPEPATIKKKYYDAETRYRQFKNAGDLAKAKEALEEQIILVATNPGLFSESDDRVRILQFRQIMLARRQARSNGKTREAVDLLRAASKQSTPSVCPLECQKNFSPDFCLNRRESLSVLQRRMCIEKINALVDALKLEGALNARRFRYDAALQNRRAAVEMHEVLLELNPQKKTLGNHIYLQYWLFVTDGYWSLLNGEFDLSKQHFEHAAWAAHYLNPHRCFPNYFANLREIQSHGYYIDGVALVHSGDFAGAERKFAAWLDINRGSSTRFRSDNIAIFELCCRLTARLSQKQLHPGGLRELWRTLNGHLEQSYVARTTWVLYKRLRWIMSSLDNARDDYEAATAIDATLRLREDWNLFVFEAILLGNDRLAGLERPLVLPRFLDVFPHLDPRIHNWQDVLVQNLKNSLLLRADYECILDQMSPPDEGYQVTPAGMPRAIERMGLKELGDVVLEYLRRRSNPLASHFQRAVERFDALTDAIEAADFERAIMEQRNIFDVIRSWPHVLLIQEHKPLPPLRMLEEGEADFVLNETRALRVWNSLPKEMIILGPQKMKINSYYYMRPNWHVRKNEIYYVRHEIMHHTPLPRRLDAFFEGMFYGEKADKKKFHDWILQVRGEFRLVAMRLYCELRLFAKDEMTRLWGNVFRMLPPEVRRSAVFIGLGHGAKSGRLNPYLFRQGVSVLPEYDAVFAGREMKMFRDLAEFEKSELGLAKPSAVVFLDDFIGTGGQAKDFLNWYFPKYPWLEDAAVFLAVLVGFRKAIQEVKDRPDGKVQDIIAAVSLGEQERAFSAENPLWASRSEREEAMEWAREIGRSIIRGRTGYEEERDALGWHDCQALVAFEHNIPSDTLPLFWGIGEHDGKRWRPLFDRYD